jgi:hypothetical protein
VFEHRLFQELEVEVVATPKGRYYKIHDGSLLPSVTTVLGRMINKSGLVEWRKRVGYAEADRITSVAGRRGSIIHDAVEKLVLNEPVPELVFAEQAMFQGVRPILEKNIGTVFGVEMPLYSKSLWAAGRTDLLAEWSGVPSVIDYKTTRFEKKEENILSYFLQSATYAFMASSIYGISFHQVVIVMIPIHEKPVIFVKDVKEYFEEVVDLFLKHRLTFEDHGSASWFRFGKKSPDLENTPAKSSSGATSPKDDFSR